MKRKIVNLTKTAGLAATVLLVSCASTPAPSTQIVQVPVPVSCVKDAPARPEYEFDRLPATASDGDKILALVRDWARYRKYTGELEAVIVGCH
ncbi:hypothetical protein [Duganella callida]|uniref:Uncharacterized protein n=1 Tax=Duganella callida TaxID=2561932 RepID=A0A4Y9S3T0_9BURK|nr:hypothetical protein [Duganella callida]TFW15980.1 hypothetical protein E4L98_25130 [Duganella callida]